MEVTLTLTQEQFDILREAMGIALTYSEEQVRYVLHPTSTREERVAAGRQLGAFATVQYVLNGAAR